MGDHLMNERFQLRAWIDGYAIYDRGIRISTIHGPQFSLACRLLRLLRDVAVAEAAL